jgi:MGT family glycosyltransferase
MIFKLRKGSVYIMSKVLFLGIPSHGHVNPTIGLVSELVKQGEEVIYFASEEFKEKIESTGAIYKEYNEDLNLFKKKEGDSFKNNSGGPIGAVIRVIALSKKIIGDILWQTKDVKFDYIIYSAAFPFGNIIAQILKIPTISSHAVFAGIKKFINMGKKPDNNKLKVDPEILKIYEEVSASIYEAYSVKMPENMMSLIFNEGDINFIYTSKYFISESDLECFNESYKFVGPPIYDRKEDLDFPFEKLEGKKVIYISLGTVFSKYNMEFYDIFFKSFESFDGIVVVAAYNVDLSQFEIPDNFIVRNYVPQSEILKYTDAAITHAGMNSISDLVYNNVPFIALPMGADQPALAQRAEELGAAISLDVNKLDAEILRTSVEKVLNNLSYIENLKKISDSFKEAGGYKRAVEEVFKLKKEKGIV